MVAPTVAKASRWTGADTVLQEHQAAVANLGMRLMRAFVIFNGVARSGAIVWHGTARIPPPPVLAAMWCPAIATWPYFSPGPVIITYDSTGHPPNTGAAQSNLSPFAVHTLGEEGRKSTRGGRNNSVAAAAHPPSQCRQNRSHTITHTHTKKSARSRSPTQNSDNDPHKNRTSTCLLQLKSLSPIPILSPNTSWRASCSLCGLISSVQLSLRVQHPCSVLFSSFPPFLHSRPDSRGNKNLCSEGVILWLVFD